MSFEEWLARAQALGASDLHLETDTPVVARIRGELQPIGPTPASERLLQAGQDLLGAEGWAQFRARGSADVALALGEVRCRASFFQTVRGIGIAIRLLTPAIKDLRTCNLHPDFHRLIEATSGLVIISGPTGSGKSTTLAALLEEINAARARHIVTLESPLEYLFTNRRAFIRQREIPTHSPSFEQGITDALRENPDVLVIGEMRTPEVMRLTLNAAETGHLVIATMHSATCAEALSRICLSFAAELQSSIRAQLADCLVGVSCQRLDFLSAHQLRVPRCELLLASAAAKGTIRSGNFSQLANVLQSGGEDGLWSFQRYQRWMEGIDHWVRPMTSPPREGAELRTSAEGTGIQRTPVTRLGATASAATRPGRGGATASQVGSAREGPLVEVASKADGVPVARSLSAEDVIEVPNEEMGLADLAELARQLAERKP